jgi:hypothetical protein
LQFKTQAPFLTGFTRLGKARRTQSRRTEMSIAFTSSTANSDD